MQISKVYESRASKLQNLKFEEMTSVVVLKGYQFLSCQRLRQHTCRPYSPYLQIEQKANTRSTTWNDVLVYLNINTNSLKVMLLNGKSFNHIINCSPNPPFDQYQSSKPVIP
jgi:hypothetical protein